MRKTGALGRLKKSLEKQFTEKHLLLWELNRHLGRSVGKGRKRNPWTH